jgi:hypothetical protein
MVKILRIYHFRVGVLGYRCGHCEGAFKYLGGRKKYPRIKEVERWMEVARCPYCKRKIKEDNDDNHRVLIYC